MNKKIFGLRSHDIQSGLYKYQDALIDISLSQTIKIGKAASLAAHMRGVQLVENKNALQVMASKLGITSIEFETVLNILQEIEYIRIIKENKKFKRLEVLGDDFDDVYKKLGEYWDGESPSEFEMKTIDIVNRLSDSAISSKAFYDQYDIRKEELEVLQTLGKTGGFLDTYLHEGQQHYYSPIYMDENPNKILSFLNSYDDKLVSQTLQLLQAKPGYPINDLNSIKNSLIIGIMGKNIFPTPAINASGGQVSFMFSPFDGITDKNMLNHARLLISAVRYGEKFSKISTLRDSSLFLTRLLERNYIGKNPHTDILPQYTPLRDCGLGRIEEIGTGTGRYRFYLADTKYAKDVVKLAIKMLDGESKQFANLTRGIVDEAWEQRKKLSNYEFNDYVPGLYNSVKINKQLEEKQAINKSNIVKSKLDTMINQIFIKDGADDVLG